MCDGVYGPVWRSMCFFGAAALGFGLSFAEASTGGIHDETRFSEWPALLCPDLGTSACQGAGFSRPSSGSERLARDILLEWKGDMAGWRGMTAENAGATSGASLP